MTDKSNTQAAKLGPVVTIHKSCSACSAERSESYKVQSDSGQDVYCTHPSVGKKRIGDTCWVTPEWCPVEVECAALAAQPAPEPVVQAEDVAGLCSIFRYDEVLTFTFIDEASADAFADRFSPSTDVPDDAPCGSQTAESDRQDDLSRTDEPQGGAVALQGRDTSAPSMPTPSLPFNTFTCKQVEKLHLDWANYTATIRASLPAGGVVAWRDLFDGEDVAAGDRILASGKEWRTIDSSQTHIIGGQYNSNIWRPVQRPVATPQPSETQGRRQMPDDVAEFLLDLSKQKPEKPDYWSSCGQCDHNIDKAQDLCEAHGIPASPQDGGANG